MDNPRVNTSPRYLNYNQALRKQFDQRVQKIAVNAGFTCPNRDGSKGFGGCTYCNNQTFSPGYSHCSKTVRQQLTDGTRFFHHKYQEQYYLAYFQSYTNTYDTTENLRLLYEEALSYPQVKGLVIGTRPDCVDNELLDYLSRLAKQHYIMIEYGIESTDNATLALINRGHDFACAERAVRETAERGLFVSAHIILGLPKESRETILSHTKHLSALPLTALKIHQLQIIKGTTMAQQYLDHPEWFHLFEADEYIELCIDFLERLHPSIAVERFVSQSPVRLRLAPDWGLKNFEFTAKIEKRLQERDTWQGRLF
ncbi:MAG: TIGR01212 family radical SAM protein [Prevotellaceae bacterium]|jgi:radical SAM protein (TIGR01212 family)|nr:TIGR01212 family radical SAM protein [Prevotellaceae bacterium]